MDHHHHHHQVRGVAVKTAHDAGVEPLVLREIFDRLVRAFDPGVEKNEEINAADRDDPEEEKTERAELRQWVERRAEQAVEWLLDQGKTPAERAADCADHIIPSSGQAALALAERIHSRRINPA